MADVMICSYLKTHFLSVLFRVGGVEIESIKDAVLMGNKQLDTWLEIEICFVYCYWFSKVSFKHTFFHIFIVHLAEENMDHMDNWKIETNT